MKKPKSVLCLILAGVLLFGASVAATAADPAALPALKAAFADGVGPAVNGLAVDYVYYTPEVAAGKKLPLVIFFHGAGQGAAPRA